MSIQPQLSVFCRPLFHQVKADVSLSSLSEVVAGKSLPAILGGNASVEEWSIFTAEPVEVFEFSLEQDKPFEKLHNVLSKYQIDTSFKRHIPAGMFCGGWIGFFAYELGRSIEVLPGRAVDDLGFPVIRLAFYDKAILFNHEKGQFYTVALDYDSQCETTDQKNDDLKYWIRQAQREEVPEMPPSDMEGISTDDLLCNVTQSQYMSAIEKIKRYIYDGETYQINFSQRFCAEFQGRAADLFHWQNRYNPSPYAAYLSWNERAVVSVSPELFLAVAGHTVTTKPIKGTRSRNPDLPDDNEENATHFHDLVLSEKDQAELAMIVDLERNDLARICVPGTRRVICKRKIETFPTVYHAVGEIQGQLCCDAEPERVVEILRATFPGGSITGAPKIRSMEIIDELEPTARGLYTGSIGWIGVNFDFCWNIAIRTILLSGRHAYIQTGGGIVADSDPDAEWKETLTKARALLAGVRAVNR